MYDEGCSLSNAYVVFIQYDANVVKPSQVYDLCCSWMVVLCLGQKKHEMHNRVEVEN